MKVKLQAQARFELEITRAHLEVLMLYSSSHYDATCRSVSIEANRTSDHYAGLLIGWRNTLDFYQDSDKSGECMVYATDHQIDVLQKCLEFRHPVTNPDQEALRVELQTVFRECRKRWSGLYDVWRLEWDVR